jgi:hypothetical protein
MRRPPRRLTKRNAPRRRNTERTSKTLLLVEKVIIHARAVNRPAPRGVRSIGAIPPGILAQLVAVRGGKATR